MTKRNIRIALIIFLIILIFTPSYMRIKWEISEKKEMNVFVLDKTVLNQKDQEHISLFWVLNNSKFIKPNGELYSHDRDYYGFFPDGKGYYKISDIENKSYDELEELADRYDMVYYTDLYGIYDIEWYNEYPEISPENFNGRIGERSHLIYGGLTLKELELLKKAKAKNKLIINEFNIIASPTSYELRKEYEATFDIKWSGWVGRYYDILDTNLNKELPLWLTRNYMEQNNNEWPFKKSGIAFVRNDDKIVVLENETHLNNEVPYIYTKKSLAKYYNVDEKIKYPFWFDICSTDHKNEVLSEYRIEVNIKGDSILKQWNIPNKFPAVFKSKERYPYYYFAGDFADNPVSLKTSKFKYVNLFHFLFHESKINERTGFFMKFYIPLMQKILEDYYNSIAKNE